MQTNPNETVIMVSQEISLLVLINTAMWFLSEIFSVYECAPNLYKGW